MVTIRQATIADASSIAQVHVDTWRFAYVGIVPQAFLGALNVGERTTQWESWIAGALAHIFVVENAEGVCGFISGGVLRAMVSM